MSESIEHRTVTVVGFTGTQRGMTQLQEDAIRNALTTAPSFVEAHHGDCVGADADFHAIARDVGARVIIHPPDNPTKRAFCAGDESRPEKPYLQRNHDIVDAADILFATPGGPEELRSGTWATIRYAKKTGVRVMVVYPDGRAEVTPGRPNATSAQVQAEQDHLF